MKVCAINLRKFSHRTTKKIGVDKHVKSPIRNSFFSENLAVNVVVTLPEKSQTLCIS